MVMQVHVALVITQAAYTITLVARGHLWTVHTCMCNHTNYVCVYVSLFDLHVAMCPSFQWTLSLSMQV